MDLYIISALFIAAAIVAVVYWLVTRKSKTPASVIPMPVPHSVPELRYTHANYYPYGYNAGATIVESNSGFHEGLVFGSMQAASRPVVIREVDEVVVREEVPVYVPVSDDPPAFHGFSGGDSDGGGATSSWDAPSSSDNSCSSDSSSSDTCSSDS